MAKATVTTQAKSQKAVSGITQKDWAKIDQKFDTLVVKFSERFEKIDQRFDKIDQRFEKIDEKFDKIDERFEKIDRKFENADDQFERVINKLVDHDTQLENIKENIVTKKEFREESNRVNTALDAHYGILKRLDTEQTATRSAIQRHERQLEQLNAI